MKKFFSASIVVIAMAATVTLFSSCSEDEIAAPAESGPGIQQPGAIDNGEFYFDGPTKRLSFDGPTKRK